MKDLIEEAFDDTEDEKSGVGKIGDHTVKVTKEHLHTPKNQEYWAVKVYANDNEIPSSKETGLDAHEAEDLFQQHASEYDLVKGPIDQDRLCDDESDDENMWCKECGTKAKLAPGIGHYCPNHDCEVGDSPELTTRKTDSDEGDEIRCEDCEECGGTLYTSDRTVHITGFPDSYPAKCEDCGHTKFILSL